MRGLIEGVFLLFIPDPVNLLLTEEFRRRSAEPGNSLRRMVKATLN